MLVSCSPLLCFLKEPRAQSNDPLASWLDSLQARMYLLPAPLSPGLAPVGVGGRQWDSLGLHVLEDVGSAGGNRHQLTESTWSGFLFTNSVTEGSVCAVDVTYRQKSSDFTNNTNRFVWQQCMEKAPSARTGLGSPHTDGCLQRWCVGTSEMSAWLQSTMEIKLHPGLQCAPQSTVPCPPTLSPAPSLPHAPLPRSALLIQSHNDCHSAYPLPPHLTFIHGWDPT